MDNLLRRAEGLYKERQKIALAALMLIFVITLFLFYSPGIYEIGTDPPQWFPPGWVQGYEVVYSFNTVGFFLAVAIMVFTYAFWNWAFLPEPARIYTFGVIHGLFGEAEIQQSLGKRLRILLEDGRYIDIRCRIREHDSGEWFVYQLSSCPLESTNLRNLALRHGMSVKDDSMTTWVSNDEFHHRLFLMAKAMTLVPS